MRRERPAKADTAVRVFLGLLAAALFLAVIMLTMHAQRERQLSRLLNDWPESDRSAASLLGSEDEGLPRCDLFMLDEGEAESLFLIFSQPEALFAAELPLDLWLDDSEGGMVSRSSGQGLAAFLDHLQSSAGISPRRCFRLQEKRLASLLESAGREGLYPDAGKTLELLRELGREGRRSEKAGLSYLACTALWKETFTPGGVEASLPAGAAGLGLPGDAHRRLPRPPGLGKCVAGEGGGAG